jgi:RHS repeat-associated protein
LLSVAGPAAQFRHPWPRRNPAPRQHPEEHAVSRWEYQDTATNQINTAGYAYDAAGNMTNDGFHSYTYDAEGNMTAVDGGQTASYLYNAQNQRVRAVTSGGATEYVFNAAGQRVSEWNGTTRAQLKGKYYWGAMPVAYYAGGAAHFEHQDWLGTERMRTAYNGSVESTFTSLPWGDGQAATGTDTDANHYAGLDHDTETDTDHAQYRQYANVQGRWLSPDPYSGSYDLSNPQSMNRYAYVENNPLANVDPLGLVTPVQWILQQIQTAMGGGGFTTYNAGLTQANSGYFGNYSNEFGILTSTTTTNGTYGGNPSQVIPNPDYNPNDPNSSQYLALIDAAWHFTTYPAGLDLIAMLQNGNQVTAPTAPNNVAHTALAGSFNIPTPIPGVIIDIPLAIIPSTHKFCAGIGGGVGSPGFSGGVVYSSQNIEGVLSGYSTSGSGQAGAFGSQVIVNSSGIAGGNSVGSPGAAITGSYSWCF